MEGPKFILEFKDITYDVLLKAGKDAGQTKRVSLLLPALLLPAPSIATDVAVNHLFLCGMCMCPYVATNAATSSASNQAGIAGARTAVTCTTCLLAGVL
jgi:hypothetical protein